VVVQDRESGSQGVKRGWKRGEKENEREGLIFNRVGFTLVSFCFLFFFFLNVAIYNSIT
jgi:hypothetical protein